MAEGLKRHDEMGRSKKVAPPVYRAEDYMKIKKELVAIGAEGLVSDINNMIKYGVEFKNGIRTRSEETRFEPKWKNDHRAYEKEKKRRLDMFSQTSTYFRSQTLSNQRDSTRMQDIMNATTSINFRSTGKPSNHQTMQSTGQAHVFIQQTKLDGTKSDWHSRKPSLPAISSERKDHQVRLGFLNELDENTYQEPGATITSWTKQSPSRPPYGLHIQGEFVQKAETLTSLDVLPKTQLPNGRQIAIGHLQIPFIKEESRGESMYTRYDQGQVFSTDRQPFSLQKNSSDQIPNSQDNMDQSRHIRLKSTGEMLEDNLRSPPPSTGLPNLANL